MKKKITIHDKHVFRASTYETIWYKDRFMPICAFDAGTPQSCGLMEIEAIHIKEGKTMPRGIYQRNNKSGRKFDFQPGKLKISTKALNKIARASDKNKSTKDKLLHALDIAHEVKHKPLQMEMTGLEETVDNILFPNSKNDVDHPAHYGGDTLYEVIKVAEHWLTREEFIGAMKFQVLKYTPRAGKKNSETEVEDNEKSIWYQTYLVDFLKRNPKIPEF